MKRVDLLYFEVTSGHRSAAMAIQKALLQTDPDLRVRLVNFVDLLQHHRLLHHLAELGVTTANMGVRLEQTWFLSQRIGFFQWLQENLPPATLRNLTRFWAGDAPDVVVSVIPFCNLMVERILHLVNPQAQYIVLPQDYEEPKRHYWFDRRMDASYINATAMLMEQARAAGIPAERCIRIAGFPIDPLFYAAAPADKAAALSELGLNPALPTILVGFGGQGSILVKRCAEQLRHVQTPFNAILMCGRYQKLKDDLSTFATPYPKVVLGFTPEAPGYYYQLADIMIGKPGSMTITEALVSRTALLAVEAQALALVQRANEKWLRQSGVGEVIRLPALPAAVERLLATSTTLQAHIQREWHDSIFETAAIIARVAHGQGLHPDTEVRHEIAKS
jgi:hypothetical protein